VLLAPREISLKLLRLSRMTPIFKGWIWRSRCLVFFPRQVSFLSDSLAFHHSIRATSECDLGVVMKQLGLRILARCGLCIDFLQGGKMKKNQEKKGMEISRLLFPFRFAWVFYAIPLSLSLLLSQYQAVRSHILVLRNLYRSLMTEFRRCQLYLPV
jgi:hypothetical protein